MKYDTSPLTRSLQVNTLRNINVYSVPSEKFVELSAVSLSNPENGVDGLASTESQERDKNRISMTGARYCKATVDK